MKRTALYFTVPEAVALREEPLPEPDPHQLQVQVLFSAISPGSELLIYHDQAPDDVPLDETIPALVGGGFSYPLKYGYALVGQVTAVGADLDPAWLGRTVFSFHPHESHFNASPDELLPLPAGISAEEALFLPNMETAVNLALDGAPLLGEQVVVFGQGIVGLLTTSLLAEFPLQTLLTLDAYPQRREHSLAIGADASFDPYETQATARVLERLGAAARYDGADLVYELSGSPQALDQAIGVCGFAGRIVVGSWYGQKRAPLNLGGRFHRARLRLISSQVSTLAPQLSGRWSKSRRLEAAWQALGRVKPAQLITHRFPFQQAEAAYRLLAESPDEVVQVIFKYG